MYSEDSVIYIKEDVKTKSDAHQRALERSAISLKNRLTMNADKSKTFTFCNQKDTNHHENHRTEKMKIHSVAVNRYPVILLDKHPSFQQIAVSVVKN